MQPQFPRPPVRARVTGGVTVRLTGLLICRTAAEADAVRRHLPAHVAASRAEAGCLTFTVTPLPHTADAAAVWQVDETFDGEAAFAAHQQRAAASAWGLATAGIARDYRITRDGPAMPS